MSFGAMWEYKRCACGVEHMENEETLGYRPGKCGVCLLAENLLENEYEVVSTVKYAITHSEDLRHMLGKNVSSLSDTETNDIVRDLCKKNNISDDVIDEGLKNLSDSMLKVKKLFNRCGDLSSKLTLDLPLYFNSLSIHHFVKFITDGVRSRKNKEKALNTN